MASKAEIKKAILDVAGNPDSGVIFQLADAWAEAIVGLGSEAPVKPESKDAAGKVEEVASQGSPAKEVRVIKPAETR
jgi:hypothetical protein